MTAFADTLKRQVEFREALSYIPLHNHLNNAYHAADMYGYAPPTHMMWKIPATLVPAKVRQHIDADRVVANLRKDLARARQLLEQDRRRLDAQANRLIHHSPDHPYANLHRSIVLVRNTPKGYAPGWCYLFNPYRLGIALLDEYEQLIDKVVRSRRAPFTQVSQLCEHAKKIEQSAKFVADSL